MNKFILLAFLLYAPFLQAQDKDLLAIQQVLDAQNAAWNEGNLEKFMEGYWNSDKLKFIGSRGLQEGWQKTLDNYKKSYPDKATMGKLTFTILSKF